jgi:hypothetical protein
MLEQKIAAAIPNVEAGPCDNGTVRYWSVLLGTVQYRCHRLGAVPICTEYGSRSQIRLELYEHALHSTSQRSTVPMSPPHRAPY